VERQATKADLLYARLKADILNGRFEPGRRLAHNELSDRYGVGVGVLREVLPRLVERGLATSEPQLGYRVLTVSADDLRDLTEARVTIETLVLRQSVAHGDLGWEGTVVAAHHRLDRTPLWRDSGVINEDWLDLHARFHHALLEGCPNRRLVDVASNLRDVAEIYRCWAQLMLPSRPRDVAREHTEITEATIARDADAAASALAAHLSLTAEIALEAWPNAAGGNGDVTDRVR